MLRRIINMDSPKKHFARYLRKHQTKGERLLWMQLRAQRFHGLKFRHQVPFGPYITDFLCVAKKLIIEVDGITHEEPDTQRNDALREAFLRKHGFSVIRFTDDDILRSLDDVIGQLEHSLGFSGN